MYLKSFLSTMCLCATASFAAEGASQEFLNVEVDAFCNHNKGIIIIYRNFEKEAVDCTTTQFVWKEDDILTRITATGVYLKRGISLEFGFPDIPSYHEGVLLFQTLCESISNRSKTQSFSTQFSCE